MASTGDTWRLGHRPALDGVRGVAIVLVLLCHSVPSLISAGTVGVTLFFALSGFLITSQILERQERDGRIGLGRFYRARAYRLLPALVVSVVAVLAVSLWLGQSVGRSVEIGVPILLYVGNWAALADGSASFGMLNPTWSLAVEEQFYLVWPLVIILIAQGRRRIPTKFLAAVMVAACLYAVVARVVLWDGGAGQHRVYIGTDTHIDGLLVGGLLALAMRRLGPRRIGPTLVAAAFAVLAICLFVGDGAARYLIVPVAVPLAAVPLLAAAGSDQQSVHWLTWGPLRQAGRISYGLYLWNYPCIWLCVIVFAPTSGMEIARTLGLVLTVAMSLASWVLVEQPFQKVKQSSWKSRHPRLDVAILRRAVPNPEGESAGVI